MGRLAGTIGMLGMVCFMAGCSLYSEAPPPQAPGPTIINNTPPSDNSASWMMITILVVGLVVAVGAVMHFRGKSEMAAARAATAENTVAHLLGQQRNALPSLNGQYMYPSTMEQIAQMPMAHPSMQMLERGQ